MNKTRRRRCRRATKRSRAFVYAKSVLKRWALQAARPLFLRRAVVVMHLENLVATATD